MEVHFVVTTQEILERKRITLDELHRRLVERNLCPCDSCAQTKDLKLKFVAHVGEVATQTIKRRSF